MLPKCKNFADFSAPKVVSQILNTESKTKIYILSRLPPPARFIPRPYGPLKSVTSNTKSPKDQVNTLNKQRASI